MLLLINNLINFFTDIPEKFINKELQNLLKFFTKQIGIIFFVNCKLFISKCFLTS